MVTGTLNPLGIAYDWELGSVTVVKHVQGSSPTGQFAFAVSCTAVDYDELIPAPVPIPVVGDATFALAAGRQHTVDALAGAACRVSETERRGAVATTYTLDSGPMQPLGAGADVVLAPGPPSLLTVTNAYPLPATGAASLLGAALLGVALLGAGATMIALRRPARHSARGTTRLPPPGADGPP
jgi:hypothetical protein